MSAESGPSPPRPSLGHSDSAAHGRKRSRSGSRLPQATPATPSARDRQALLDRTLSQIIERDRLHADALEQQHSANFELIQRKLTENQIFEDMHRRHDPAALYGLGYAGFGNGRTDELPMRLLYPAQRKRPGNRRSKELRIPRRDMRAQAELLEELVPIRLDIEYDKLKLRDTFTWNLHDRVVSPEAFAEHLVEDFKLPPEAKAPLTQQIQREVHEQLQDFYPHVFIEEEPLDPHHFYNAYKNDEMRILIKLNITIGQHTLVDQFEWEINNPLNSPEEFARQMSRDLSLSGEFTTAIAHSIREQSQMFTKSLYISGHPFDGRPIEDSDVRDGFLPSPLPSVFRPVQSTKDYTPYLYELNETDLERAELSILRDQRRQKRSVNRRGGPALPDLKDRPRTVRTLVVSSVLPGAAESVEESRLFKTTRATSGRGRRAARGDGDESEESESEDSAPDSPAPLQITGGTARTRGLRGAASAAQAAMKANLGRSATPEVAAIHHHETRTSSRRVGHDVLDESGAGTLIVKLKISRQRYRDWMRVYKAKVTTAEQHQGRLTAPPSSAPVDASTRSRSAAGSMPPPPSPAMKQEKSPSPSSQLAWQWRYHEDGRVDATYPLPTGSPVPPPPDWLVAAVRNLKEKYLKDAFEGAMRYTAIDQSSGSAISLKQNVEPPPNVKFYYLPRVRCLDCPGKLYTPGPGHTVDNFETHLKNRQHKDRVEQRQLRAKQGRAVS
ncbi:hypothetical protein BDY21DRAFT_385845 [Lineolata rhizophorae]|uniref:SNF5-domain-containing protein n=1 Tax=Lineolata rhizophorae TaxID=578093 RepID=A0A6A6P0S5_9PEZI|nr:hypothetical protein BDY21DRAFT_385845 [Lineolata rhizophorae]